jgi:transposase-like protein
MTEPRCSVCLHPQVEAIEASLRAGTPAREVAREFGIGRNVLARHRCHLQEPGANPSPSPALAGGTLTERRIASCERALFVLAEAEASGRLPLVVQALRGARASARMLRRDTEAGDLSSADRERVENLYQRTVAVVERSRGLGSLELASLEALRGALDDLAAVTEPVPEEFFDVVLTFADGSAVAPQGEPAWATNAEWRETGVLELKWSAEPLRTRPYGPVGLPEPNGHER